ncbi:hypothetical protein V8E36_005635 [Tilletia maclaganii]
MDEEERPADKRRPRDERGEEAEEEEGVDSGPDRLATLKFFKKLRSEVVDKTARRTGKLYKEVDEKWQCLLCHRTYTAHPTNRSNLALHLNTKSNRNFCQKLYDPIDKRFAGVFKPPSKPVAEPISAAIVSPASGANSTPTNAVGAVRRLTGQQQSLDGWVAAQGAAQLDVKVAMVRERILEWLAILKTLCPGIDDAMKSPRTLRRDLEDAFNRVRQQVVQHIQTNKIPFAASHDAWTSPSRRYSFLAVVVSYIDTDWTFKQVLVGFEVLEGPHTGAYLAGTLMRVLAELELLDRWTGILVGDAASSNLRMSDAVVPRDLPAHIKDKIRHKREDHAIFCINHAFNRAMQDLYGSVGVSMARPTKTLRDSAEGGVTADGDGEDDPEASVISDSDQDEESDAEISDDDAIVPDSAGVSQQSAAMPEAQGVKTDGAGPDGEEDDDPEAEE